MYVVVSLYIVFCQERDDEFDDPHEQQQYGGLVQENQLNSPQPYDSIYWNTVSFCDVFLVFIIFRAGFGTTPTHNFETQEYQPNVLSNKINHVAVTLYTCEFTHVLC